MHDIKLPFAELANRVTFPHLGQGRSGEQLRLVHIDIFLEGLI